MGGQAAKILLKKVADSLIAKLPSGGVLSYIKDGCFVFLIRGASVKQVQKEAEALIHAFHKTKVIGGYPVTLYVDYATARGSEARDIDGLYRLLQNRMDKKLQTATSHEKRAGCRMYFRLFDSSGVVYESGRASFPGLAGRLRLSGKAML